MTRASGVGSGTGGRCGVAPGPPAPGLVGLIGAVPAGGGAGLGLYLARELVRQVGGSITAESPGVGRGTTFRVTLPLASEEPA